MTGSKPAGEDAATPRGRGIQLLQKPVSGAIAKGLASLGTGRAGASILDFVAVAVLANRLGPSDFGVYTFAIAIVTLLRLVPNFGLLPVVTRDIAQDASRESRLIPNLVLLRLALGTFGYGLLVAVLFLSGYSEESRDAALVAGLLLLALPLDSFGIVLQVRLRLGWISTAAVAQSAVNLLGVLLLLKMDVGVATFLVVYVVAHILSMLIVGAAALRVVTLSWRPDVSSWWPLVRAAAPLAVSLLIISLYTRLDMALLAALQPGADVGQYGAAYRFLDAFLILSPLMMSVLAPVLAASQRDSLLLQRRYARALHFVMLLALPVAVLGSMLSYRLVPALPGFAEFEGAGVALSIMAPAAAFIIIGTVVQGTLIGAHLQSVLLRISLGGLLVNVVVVVVLIPKFSYVGAAVGTTVTEVFVVGWSVVAAKQRLGLRLPLRRVSRALPALLAAGATVLLTAKYGVFVQLGASALVYAAGAFAGRALTPDDLRGVSLKRRPGTSQNPTVDVARLAQNDQAPMDASPKRPSGTAS